MVGRLLTLPLRVSLRGTGLAVRAVRGAAGTAWSAGSHALGAVAPAADRAAEPARERGPAEPGRAQDAQGAPPRDPRSSSRNGGEPAIADPPPPAPGRSPDPPGTSIDFDAPGPLDPSAGHVTEEPELVEQRADPGAEDGAGAQVRVREPWPGYSKMNARDIADRVQGADPAQLLAVRLYESAHRGRAQVLRAVERKLAAG